METQKVTSKISIVWVQSAEAHRVDTAWLRRWIDRLRDFLVGQGLLQVLNLFAGFLLVRWLSVTDYAAYSLVTGFQGTVGILVDLNICSSAIALIKGRTTPSIVGGYICSARRYQKRLFLVLLPVTIVTFCVLALRQGWSWSFTGILLCAVLVGLYFQSLTACYSVPLLVRQELNAFYRPPVILGFYRLASSVVLYKLTLLTSVSAAWISALCVAVQGWLYKKISSSYIAEPSHSSPITNLEICTYIRPLIPGTVFFALQGQVSVLLISWFGRSQHIAEVGALGRLGQLFVMLGAFNGVVIAPNIARISPQILKRRYIQVIAGAMLVSLGLVVASACAPRSLLWLLGEKYHHLEPELSWMMLSACINYLSGVMWTMHGARHWNFRWVGWLTISTVLVTQAVALLITDVSDTKGVILFSLYSSLATLVVHVIWAFYGFAVHNASPGEESM
ncbi:lipopolysaccharide biosynthesis protein [Verrucomicrobiota bacterium sgz303538]